MSFKKREEYFIDCAACNGTGIYDSHNSPPCGACDGTGKESCDFFDGKEAKKLYKKGEDRLEYLDQYGNWCIMDHKFDGASMFGFYDKWRIY